MSERIVITIGAKQCRMFYTRDAHGGALISVGSDLDLPGTVEQHVPAPVVSSGEISRPRAQVRMKGRVGRRAMSSVADRLVVNR